MNHYEILYILKADLDETLTKELVERFNGVITNNGGSIDSIDEWGKRRLAYSIDYNNEGYYVLEKFTAPATLPAELERNMKINENVLRYLVTRLD